MNEYKGKALTPSQETGWDPVDFRMVLCNHCGFEKGSHLYLNPQSQNYLWRDNIHDCLANLLSRIKSLSEMVVGLEGKVAKLLTDAAHRSEDVRDGRGS